MSLTIKESGPDFELTPEGTFIARCFKVIDLGTQEVDYQGQVKHSPKMMVVWELPTEVMKNGQPFAISKRYTSSLHEKATLRKDLEAWRGKAFTDEELQAFNVGKLLGSYCLLSIIHIEKNGKKYSTISAIMKLPNGMEKPEPINPSVFFDLDYFNPEIFNELGEGLKETIKKSPEWQALNNEINTSDLQTEEDICF